MLVVPLTNSPNQSFYSSIPINGENREFKLELWYNYEANYWLLSATDLMANKKLFTNLPLLVSYGRFANILCQLAYKQIGFSGVLPRVSEFPESMPDDENLGTSYILIWGDNL